jgi:hypothetical protein
MHIRDLESVAAENAVEGCLRETVGALVAHGQSLHAQDPVLRAASKVIARDEARHATLAFHVDRWARGRLSPLAHRRLNAAVGSAATSLAGEAAEPSSAALLQTAGLPSPDTLPALISLIPGAASPR